jgi:hypothetical protein
MMRNTPRTFVGTVAFQLQEMVCRHVAELVQAHTELLPGVRVADFDAAGGMLMVTAQVPADRSEVIDALARLGCRVRA